MSGSQRQLDFLVIGASKSGTTSLFQYLRHHPGIFIPPEKEVPFFSFDEWVHRGWEWFLEDYFSAAPTGSLWGTVTPQYLEDASRVAPRIAERLPEARLITLLRHPVERAFSSYRMRVMKGREQRSFEQVVEEQLRPAALERARRLVWDPAITTDTYLVTGEYGRLLRPFAERFPRQRLLVEFSERLAGRPGEVLDAILAFLGLETGYRPPNLGRRYYVGGNRRRFPQLAAAARRVAPLRWLWLALPAQRRRSILWWYQTEFNVARKAPARIPEEIYSHLVRHYRPDVAALEALIDRPVPWAELRSRPQGGTR